MEYRAYGDEGKETILLLHGGGLSWWNYREAAELLQGEYRVILPILDGHAGSGRPFTTIGENAAELIAFMDAHCGGHVRLLGGLSLGGQIALEMLSQRRNLCDCALIESAAVLPSRLTHALIGPAFGCSFGLIRQRAFARLQFRSLGMKEALFEDYYRDTCRIAKADMIAFLRASTAYQLKDTLRDAQSEVHIFCGSRENRQIRRSAETIAAMMPAAALKVLPGYAHGDFSINHADEYAGAIRTICGA